MVIDGNTSSVIDTIPTGSSPWGIGVDLVTNKIYVVDEGSDDVTIVNGRDNSIINTVDVGDMPRWAVVNHTTRKVYVPNANASSVSVIDGIGDTLIKTITQSVGAHYAAINPITNRIYVLNGWSSSVSVVDGLYDSIIATIPLGYVPHDAAINVITNLIYVANMEDNTITIVDGATNSATTIPGGSHPSSVVCNPITNKVYVSNEWGDDVTVLDGVSGSATAVEAGSNPWFLALNPVTNKIYVSNQQSDNVTVITDCKSHDVLVPTETNRLPGDTAVTPQPVLTGKAVNRWTPNSTSIMGVLTRVGTAQLPWIWAQITSGAGTDSVGWQCEWDSDSLVMGENFLCALPLEDNAATTCNLGFGTPFAGNLEVYPVYRMGYYVGAEEMTKPEVRMSSGPTIVRGVLFLEARGEMREARCELLDISGRSVLDLKPGPNDVRALAPGVYFVRQEAHAQAQAHAVRKIVIAE
jgi:YVTN family beta-propeller protein